MSEKTEKVNESQIDFLGLPAEEGLPCTHVDCERLREMRMTELKSCPFCNAHGNDVYVDEFWERYNNPYFVLCDKCGACGPYADTKEKAIENWNRRVKE